jgi:hypothetical protein
MCFDFCEAMKNLTLLPALLLGCAPKMVSISVVGAQVQPLRANGDTWDGPGLFVTEVASMAQPYLMESNPAGGAAAWVVQGLIESIEPPDLYGVATLTQVDGTTMQLLLPERADTTLPVWCSQSKLEQCPVFRGVRLKQVSRLTLSLTDADVFAPDPVAAVWISQEELIAAAKKAKLYTVVVSSQQAGEILYVYLLVTPEKP